MFVRTVGASVGAVLTALTVTVAAPQPARADVPSAPSVTAQAQAAPIPGTVVPVTPQRLLDTRSTATGGPAVEPHGTVQLPVTGSSIPTGVSAVVLNVTVNQPTAAGYVTVYADGSTQPTASNLNFVKGQTVPNLVAAPVGSNGAVDLFNGSLGTVNLIVDVTGYVVGGTATTRGGFATMAPTRLLDTRTGNRAVKANTAVTLQVAGRFGIPPGISAVVLNVTANQPTAAGYVTVYAAGTAQPTASNLNFVKGRTVPNLVVAPVSPDGKVTLFNGSLGTVNLVVDADGYFLGGSPTTNGAFAALSPSRLLDTRSTATGGPTVKANGTVHLQVTGRAGIPAGVSAVVLNVTVNQPTATGYVTVYSNTGGRPTASNLNFVKGQTVPNLVLARVGADGRIALFNGSLGTVNLVADVTGYFLGSAVTGTVTAASNGAPLAGVDVQVYTGGGATLVASTGTAADGTYLVGQLDTGTYQVCFDASVATGGPSTRGYLDQCYQGRPDDPSQATAITVISGAKTGVDGALAEAGAVSGTVTAATGSAPLGGVFVYAQQPTGVAGDYNTVATARTSATGTYMLTGLPAGLYDICLDADHATGGASTTGYVDACLPNAPWLSNTLPPGATPVTVVPGTTVTANAALTTGAAFTGTVTSTGKGVPNVAVDVFTTAGVAVNNTAGTAANGTYAVTGLSAGSYTVCFDASALSLASQCYRGIAWNPYGPLPAGTTAVPVTSGQRTAAIDAAL